MSAGLLDVRIEMGKGSSFFDQSINIYFPPFFISEGLYEQFIRA